MTKHNSLHQEVREIVKKEQCPYVYEHDCPHCLRPESCKSQTDRATAAILKAIKDRMQITPEQLHKWYLEAITDLHGENYNHKADRPYEDLNEEQKSIDKYIAKAILTDLAERMGE